MTDKRAMVVLYSLPTAQASWMSLGLGLTAIGDQLSAFSHRLVPFECQVQVGVACDTFVHTTGFIGREALSTGDPVRHIPIAAAIHQQETRANPLIGVSDSFNSDLSTESRIDPYALLMGGLSMVMGGCARVQGNDSVLLWIIGGIVAAFGLKYGLPWLNRQLKGFGTAEAKKIKNIYKEYPELKTALSKTQWSDIDQFRLLECIADQSVQYVSRSYQKLPAAIQVLEGTDWSSDQKYQFLLHLAEKAGANIDHACENLSAAIQALDGTDGSPEQKYQFLTQLADRAEILVGGAYRDLPVAMQALEGTGWSFEQKTQFLLRLADKVGVFTSTVLRDLPEAMEALEDTGWDYEEKTAFIVDLAERSGGELFGVSRLVEQYFRSQADEEEDDTPVAEEIPSDESESRDVVEVSEPDDQQLKFQSDKVEGDNVPPAEETPRAESGVGEISEVSEPVEQHLKFQVDGAEGDEIPLAEETPCDESGGAETPSAQSSDKELGARSELTESDFSRGIRVIRASDKANHYIAIDDNGDEDSEHPATEKEYKAFRLWERKQYDDVARKQQKIISDNGIDFLMQEFLSDRYQRTPSAEAILKDPKLRPTTYVRSGKHMFYLGPVIKADGYPYSIAITPVIEKGVVCLHTVIFYQSNSDGFWRATPGTEFGQARKGNGHHYTAETQLRYELIKKLEGMKGQPQVSMSRADILKYTDVFGFVGNFPTERREAIYKLFPKAMGLTVMGGLEDLQQFQPGAQSRFDNDFIESLEKLEYAEGFIPDFTQAPRREYRLSHTIFGDTVLREYPGELHGRPVIWTMAEAAEDRVWIKSIEFADAEVTQFGTPDRVINSGFLTSKPVEYIDQLGNLAQKYRRGIPGDLRYEYSDITPLLARLKPVQQYKMAQVVGKG